MSGPSWSPTTLPKAWARATARGDLADEHRRRAVEHRGRAGARSHLARRGYGPPHPDAPDDRPDAPARAERHVLQLVLAGDGVDRLGMNPTGYYSDEQN